jgi:hypothetical protein
MVMLRQRSPGVGGGGGTHLLSSFFPPPRFLPFLFIASFLCFSSQHFFPPHSLFFSSSLPSFPSTSYTIIPFLSIYSFPFRLILYFLSSSSLHPPLLLCSFLLFSFLFPFFIIPSFLPSFSFFLLFSSFPPPFLFLYFCFFSLSLFSFRPQYEHVSSFIPSFLLH